MATYPFQASTWAEWIKLTPHVCYSPECNGHRDTFIPSAVLCLSTGLVQFIQKKSYCLLQD